MKPIVRRGLELLLLAFCITVWSLTIGMSRRQLRTRTCQDKGTLEVIVEDSLQRNFVGRSDIEGWLDKEYRAYAGLPLDSVDLTKIESIVTGHGAVRECQAWLTDNGIQAKEGVNIGEDLQVMSQLAYYAGQVESIWDVVCFYDCTNDLSYMNQFDTRHIKRQLQDTESMEVVRDFFKDKDASLCDLAEKYLFQYYSSLLRYYGRAGMKEEFAGIRNRLSSLLPQNRKMSKRQVIKYRSYQLFRIADSLKHR